MLRLNVLHLNLESYSTLKKKNLSVLPFFNSLFFYRPGCSHFVITSTPGKRNSWLT